MAQYDLTKIKRNPAGMVQTGEYSFVNPDYLSQSGYQQAINYASQQSPTVLTDANIRERVIPDLNQQATNLYGTPSPYQPPTGKTTTTKTATDKQTNGLYDELKGILPDTGISEPVDPLAEEYAKFQEDIFKQMEQEVSEQAQKQTQRVADMYSSRYRDLAIQQKQAVAQKAQLGGYLFSSGVSRYGSVSGGGLVTSTERALTNQLNDLRMDEAEAIDKVREAQKEGNWRVMQARLKYAENVRAEKEAKREKLIEEIKKQNEAVNKQVIQASRDSAVAGLLQQGVVNPAQILNFLNYDQEGNLTGDFTAEEVSKTIKNLSGDQTKEVSNLSMEERIFTEAKQKGWGGLTENSSIFDYWQREKEAKTSPKAEKVGIGAGSSSDYEQFSKEQVALSVLPTQLKNSENELNRALQGIRAGLNQGKTPYQIADALTGYLITTPNSFSEGMRKYASLANLQGTEYAELARLVNAKQDSKAIALIENKIYPKIQAQQGTSYVSEADVSYVMDKVSEIDKLLGEGWTDEVGAFTGTLNNFIQRKFGGFFGGEAPAIKAKITSLTADLINKRAGSALTETEWDRLVAANVPAMNESGRTVRTKMQELIDNPMTRLNAERAQFELPTLDRQSLRNRVLRVPAYSSMTFTEYEPENLKSSLDNFDLSTGGKGTPTLDWSLAP